MISVDEFKGLVRHQVGIYPTAEVREIPTKWNNGLYSNGQHYGIHKVIYDIIVRHHNWRHWISAPCYFMVGIEYPSKRPMPLFDPSFMPKAVPPNGFIVYHPNDFFGYDAAKLVLDLSAETVLDTALLSKRERRDLIALEKAKGIPLEEGVRLMFLNGIRASRISTEKVA